MRAHPYARVMLIGVGVGIVAGIAFYGVLRLFGYTPSPYLLVGVVVACIPGTVMLSVIMEGSEIDQEEWREDPRETEGSRPPGSY